MNRQSCHNRKSLLIATGRLARRSGPSSLRTGFTVVELLVSMVILLVIVTVFVRFFQRSTQSWESGMRTVETAIAGRAAINLIVRDIERAIADPVLVKEVLGEEGPAFRGLRDGIRFISLPARGEGRAHRIAYYEEDGVLKRTVDLNDPNDVIDNVKTISFEYRHKEVSDGSWLLELELYPMPMPNGVSNAVPDGVRIVLKLSNRYDDSDARDQEFVGLAFPVHRNRYPGVE